MTAFSDTPVILWFRNDLRLSDHAGLQAALDTGRAVLPVFIRDVSAADAWTEGGASRWWLHNSLASLHGALVERGNGLVLRRGDSVAVLADLVRETGAREVFTGSSGEPWARAVDEAAAASLDALGTRLRRMRTTMLFHPNSVRTRTGHAFSVYTPFAKACLTLGGPREPSPPPASIPGIGRPASESLDSWGLLPTKPDWASGLREIWTPGETGAAERMKVFMRGGLEGYAAGRDHPAEDATSMLSPHLHFGEISAVQVWSQAYRHASGPKRHAFLREVLWREFCLHLLWHHPSLPDAPLRPEFAAMRWRDDPVALRGWQRGLTGVPIVDAGMRQLWRTGWMHNRVRMIVASFLVKHLLIPWQLGEHWFWDTLVDADLANNAANWQWVAGSGTDAAPYFRIFNPVLQGRTFDAAGDYVRRYVPELAGLDKRHIHAPWEAPAAILASAGISLGRTYPRPIVNIAEGRSRALAAYAEMRTPS